MVTGRVQVAGEHDGRGILGDESREPSHLGVPDRHVCGDSGRQGVHPVQAQRVAFEREPGLEHRDTVEIDEEGLTKWSTMTGGRYFRADDDRSLEQIFNTINSLEKTEISSTRFVSWADRFEAPLLVAALLLLVEVVLAKTALSRVPA